MSFSNRLLNHIGANLVPDGTGEIGPTDSLLDGGLIDSIGLMELVRFIEEEGGVSIPDADINPDNFETVERIAALVDHLKDKGSA